MAGSPANCHGRTAAGLNMKQPTVADKSPAVTAMEPAWAIVDALMGGTLAMRAAGVSLLPKFPSEEQKAYDARLACATLYPAYSRTVDTLTGKPFSKPVTLGDNIPAVVRAYLDDVDLQGRNLHVFAADLMHMALSHGLCGVLVDFPQASGVRTLADERARGLRPYWVFVKPGEILGWKAQRVNGQWTLTQLRLMESIDEDDGEFGTRSVSQVRVLTPGAWRTYRQNDKQEWVPHEDGVTTIKYIPFVPVYGKRTGFMTAKPPMLEMAHLNVEHWQSASDQQTIVHVARVPVLAVSGIDDDKWELKLGAASAVRLPTGAEMKYVEHTGAAIESGRLSIKDIEDRMRQAGAEMLVIKPGAITATEVASDNAIGMCDLQRLVQSTQDAINQALQVTSDWVTAGPGGSVTIFNDFGAMTMAEASAQLVLSAQQSGLVSKGTAIDELKRRGILSESVDAEAEAALVEAEGPKLGDPGANGQ